MRDFDYFDEDAQPAGSSAEDEFGEPLSMEEQLEAYRGRQKRQSRFLVLMLLMVGACIWFLSGYRSYIAYAFSSAGEPNALGDVTTFTPDDIPHGEFVSVHGITEHRGMTQKLMRGLGFGRDEFWYFRLVGSQGVFIEVPKDPSVYGVTTKLTVSGRAVDPSKERVYQSLLLTYNDTFIPKSRTAYRIIQVGVQPGEGRGIWFLSFSILFALIASNLLGLVRLLQARRNRPDLIVTDR